MNTPMWRSTPDIVPLDKVFTPTDVPDSTFVERPDITDPLVSFLRQPGRPICIVGAYRCGKTSIAIKMAERLFSGQLHVVCTPSDTFDSVLLKSFDALDAFYSQERTLKRSSSSSKLSAEYLGFKAQLGAATHEKSWTEIRVLPPQINSRTLAKFAKATDAPWIVDDVHKLGEADFVKMAEAMREWQTTQFESGPAKVVAIGTDQTPAPLVVRLIAAAPDLDGRLATIPVRLMSDTELRRLMEQGGKVLNVDFDPIAKQILKFSYGVPGLCQDICYQICAAAGVEQTMASRITLTATHLEDGLSRYVTHCAGSIGYKFSQVLSPPNSSAEANISKCILDALMAQELQPLSKEALVTSVKASLGEAPAAIYETLKHLANEEKGVLQLDSDGSLIQFKEPMYFVYYRLRAAAIDREPTRNALLELLRKVLSAN
jgi:hypothetical protein